MTRIVLFIGFICFATVSQAQLAKQLQFREETYDFGKVPEQNGPVTHDFIFTNASNRPVKIVSVQPSCGCTTPNWTKELIPPGKTGTITASFNPQGRPGFFNKSLTVTTDIEPAPTILYIKGNVVSDGTTGESDHEYVVANGNLKLKSGSFNMGKVFMKDEWAVKEFDISNAGSKPLSFSGEVTAPKYIKVEVVPATLPVGGKGIIRVKYNGFAKNQYGFQSDNVELKTDDPSSPVKSFSVLATIEDFFPTLTPEELSKAPQMRLSDQSLEMGRFSSSATMTKELSVTNTGKKDLVLKSLQSNCTCVTVSATKKVLKPGETTMVQVSFNGADRKGTNTKAVTIYSNDPRNPVQRFSVSAYIEN